MSAENLDDLKSHPAWMRLEPRSRSNDFSQGLQARTADPLWMLARQWQTGEFHGEDAGSPLEAYLHYGTQVLDRVLLGQTAELYLGRQPLEWIVEREKTKLDWRTRVQAGQQFEGLLRLELAAEITEKVAEIIQAYRQRYPIELPSGEEWVQTDQRTRRFLEFVNGRALDGKKLLEEMDLSGGGQHKVPVVEGLQPDQLAHVLSKLVDWCSRLDIGLAASKPPAWRTEQLDYRFEVNPAEPSETNQTRLVAPGYRNGVLDWHTFNTVSEYQGKWETQSLKMTPVRISLAGASPRWWAFEDGAVNFGQLDVAKPDLARLILMEFVLVYGDDWFAIPLTVEAGNLVKIDGLSVVDVFGQKDNLVSARQKVRQSILAGGGDPDDPLLRFELFTLSPASLADKPGMGDPEAPGAGVKSKSGAEVDNVLLVPPIAGLRQESAPLEEVRFLRDEGANMVWAVEQFVRDGLGRQVTGLSAQAERISRRQEAETEDSQPTSRDAPRYRLATTVPENWFPFIPSNARSRLGWTGIRLRRAEMLRNMDDEAPVSIPAMSHLLGLEDELLLWLEESVVPRSGLWYQLTAQRLRWFDGKTYVWLGRKVLAGRGEGSSGLRFDVLIDK